MNRTKVKTIDDLPQLPFEKVLSYLSLEDRLKSRAVSRSWYHRINSFKVKSLCFSRRPLGFISGKSRWITGTFDQNFISSTRFSLFFNTFGQTILSSLKRLRLCDLYLDGNSGTAFTRILNSFGHLEDIGLFCFGILSSVKIDLELNLPMLRRIQLERVWGIGKLTLEAPRLRNIKCWYCSLLNLVIVHGESVECLLASWLGYTAVKKLKNLKALYTEEYKAESTLLSDLSKLKEIHLHGYREDVENLFDQKRRYGRTDLKIYLCGLLLNGPDDPAISSLFPVFEGSLNQLAEHPSRLADEIPFQDSLRYHAIERVDPEEAAIDLLSRFTDLFSIIIDRPVVNVARFLDVLSNFDNIKELHFFCNQPQDLFDQLPEHFVLQGLDVKGAPSDFDFLFRLKHLINLEIDCSIRAELVRELFEELPFLSKFRFNYNHKLAVIEIPENSGRDHLKRFKVFADWKWTDAPDLETAIQFLTESTPMNSRQF